MTTDTGQARRMCSQRASYHIAWVSDRQRSNLMARGGQCVRPTLNDGTTLPPVLAGDQSTTDFRVAALVRAWQRRVPLVLIAGSGYELLPFKLKLNASYAILGW
jgi:hypothetical protein